MLRKTLAFIFLCGLFIQLSGQNFKSSWEIENNPSNPTEARRSFDVSGESYLYGTSQSFFAARLSFYYGFGKNRKHFAGVQVPWGFSDYSGMNTKMGFGDMMFGYYYYPYKDISGNKSFQAAGIGLTTFAPTGNKENGLSRDAWVLTMHALFNVRINQRWAVYPMARYIFSFDSTYSKSIAIPPGNVPEPPSVDAPEKVSSFQFEAQLVYEMPKVGSWFMLSPQMSYDFQRNNYSLAMQTRLGKMFNRTFGMSFSWGVILAGEQSFKHAFQLFLIAYLK